ncbi:patatin-like phospholipase family protein [Carboxylicivirga sp. RSCT41]|uniref:patatin-like phospholipase family protein n=1 Tax=Carboxylicivirga agarovorans TaxID=3417570 RepID=UPI003D332C81
MTKILKLGFAMGGGVSLGTFSGAALTEAIKLAILHAKDEKGKAYDSVEVDVFSGASAGSMSLGVMLRGLLYQSDDAREKARKKLTKLNIKWENLPKKKQNALIAAQATQDLQEKIWVNEVNLDRLLGKAENGQRNLTNEKGILDRTTVDEIAKKHFDLKNIFPDGKFTTQRKSVLADRVLFCSTLTNLTPLLYDARPNYTNTDIFHPGLQDGLTSKGHKEARVFDLFFKKQSDDFSSKNYPTRWNRYHPGTKQDGNIGDIRSQKAWSKIIASSIACGAFPFAFEPVPLTRSYFEYGDEWPIELKEKMKQSNLSPANRDKFKTGEQYIFNYIDGGTLNNEPIREAFKLAAFLDAIENRNIEFDRKIIFVDPSVGTINTDFRVPILQEYSFSKDKNIIHNQEVFKNNTLDLLLPHLGQVLGLLMNESRSNIKDRIYNTTKHFASRQDVRHFVKLGTSNATINNNTFDSLIKEIKEKLDKDTSKKLFPFNTLTLEEELKRLIIEQEGKGSPKLDLINEFLNSRDKGTFNQASEWYSLLVFILIDDLSNLIDKDSNARLIAIAPIGYNKDGDLKPFDLPGGKLFAFGGFTFEKIRQYEFDVARYCTLLALSNHPNTQQNLVQIPFNKQITPKPSNAILKEYERKFEIGAEMLIERVEEMVKKSHLINILPGINTVVTYFLQKYIKSAIRKSLDNNVDDSFEFRIKVKNSKMEIDGTGWGNDLKPFRLDDGFYLIVVLDHLIQPINKKRWALKGTDIRLSYLDIDKDRFIVDNDIVNLKLPSEELVREAQMLPNPIFTLDLTKKINNNWKIVSGVKALDETISD